MTAITRAGWLLSAAIAAVLLLSILHTDHAGVLPFALFAAIAVVCVVRPAWGLPVAAGLVPIVWYSASQLWNSQVAWAEALACAALLGLGVDAARRPQRVPRIVSQPAVVFAAIVIAALAASLGVLGMRGGPPFWRDLAAMMTRKYFVDHSLGAVHAGLLLLEGILLFAHAARLSAALGILRRVTGATAAGAAVAAACTLLRLHGSAARSDTFWASLFDLAQRYRWNVHYSDFNAAGSAYALSVLAAVALAWTSRGIRRAGWIATAVLVAIGLWLTSSRVALLAAPAALAAALLLVRAVAGKRQLVVAAAVGTMACAALALVAILLPQRGIQKSSLVAADIRVGLIETGARMIARYPAFGIGLGAFPHRSPEFSSPELIAKFPIIATHGENAHNNVVQVAAETGLPGGLAFVWLIVAALMAVAARAALARDRFLQLLLAAVGAFALTALGGHPLLVPEAAFTFWIVLGAVAGAALADRPAQPGGRRGTVVLATALAAVAVTTPMRMRAAAQDADLEHIGIGVSPTWQISPDGIRYREAVGQATLFVPVPAFKFSVKSPGAAPVRLEVEIDDRIADVLMLPPDQWIDVVMDARTTQTDARHRRMDLRTVSDPTARLWITKDEPIAPR